MMPMAVPREASADTNGRAMAKTEPKTSSRTMPARMMPNPVPPKDTRSAASATWPATATWRSGPMALWAVATKFLASVVEMFWASVSKVTVAKAVRPSALTWLAPRGSNGLVMTETWGRSLILSSMVLTVASTDGIGDRGRRWWCGRRSVPGRRPRPGALPAGGSGPWWTRCWAGRSCWRTRYPRTGRSRWPGPGRPATGAGRSPDVGRTTRQGASLLGTPQVWITGNGCPSVGADRRTAPTSVRTHSRRCGRSSGR